MHLPGAGLGGSKISPYKYPFDMILGVLLLFLRRWGKRREVSVLTEFFRSEKAIVAGITFVDFQGILIVVLIRFKNQPFCGAPS